MSDVVPALRRLLDATTVDATASDAQTAPAPAPAERCDMCATPVPPEHRHVVELEQRRILCACRPCALLFDARGAGRGQFRLVPERVLHTPADRVPGDVWERLELPVGIVFVFHQSALERPVACYPGPAGATESLLSLSAWADVCDAIAVARLLEPDVEALLLRKTRTESSATCYLVPIDICYELVGRMRMLWHGFDGGAEVGAEIDEFFRSLDTRARPPAVTA